MALLPTLRLGTVLAAAPLVVAGLVALAWLGGDLAPRKCPRGPWLNPEGVVAPPAAPPPAAPAPPKSHDATYDPWELVSV